MKRKKIDNQIEKNIAIGLITSTKYLRRIKDLWNDDFIEIPYVSMVAEWCFDYYEKYGKSPGMHIKDIFYDKSEKGMDSSIENQMEDFLGRINKKFIKKHFNYKYLTKNTAKRFKTKAISILFDDIEYEIGKGNIDKAEELLKSFAAPSIVSSNAINPFTDKEAIKSAFLDAPKPLLTFPGALGKFWNNQFVKQSLISILAPEKRGKTWCLMDIAHRALRCHNDVAMFQTGDMSEKQMILRQSTHISMRNYRDIYCGKQWFPELDCVHNQSGECEHSCSDIAINFEEGILETINRLYEHVPCTDCISEEHFFKPTAWFREINIEQLHWSEAQNIMGRFAKRSRKEFKLSTHPNTTINVNGIANELRLWKEKEKFHPSIIIIDYADILAPEKTGENNYRHQINETWKALRRLSQEWDACVVTATQANSEANDRVSIGVGNFSEDKRKRSHITAEFGLNQTSEEKEKGIMRLNKIMVREDENTRKEVTLLGNLSLGHPWIISSF